MHPESAGTKASVPLVTLQGYSCDFGQDFPASTSLTPRQSCITTLVSLEYSKIWEGGRGGGRKGGGGNNKINDDSNGDDDGDGAS